MWDNLDYNSLVIGAADLCLMCYTVLLGTWQLQLQKHTGNHSRLQQCSLVYKLRVTSVWSLGRTAADQIETIQVARANMAGHAKCGITYQCPVV